MQDPAELQKLIQDLAAAKREYDRLAFDEDQNRELGPAASRQQLVKLEGILGKPLPPSYRAFLEQHNGWTDFVGGAKLLAVEDHDSEWVKKRLDRWNSLLDEDEESPFEQGAIPILLGEKENHLLLLDPRTQREDGEMDFVDIDNGREHARYPDFTAFLRRDLHVTRILIDRHTKGTPDAAATEGV